MRYGGFTLCSLVKACATMGKRRETKESNKQSEPAAAGKTLFVQNIPFSATSEILLDVFKNHGPINSCFVVNDPSKYH